MEAAVLVFRVILCILCIASSTSVEEGDERVSGDIKKTGP